MRHITNYTNSSQEIVLNLINHHNSTNLTPFVVDVSEPTVIVNDIVSAVVTAKYGSGYTGQQTLNYKRVSITSLTALETVQQTVFADVTSYDEIIQLFNAKYGVNLGLDDVLVDGFEINAGAYTQFRGEPIEVIITAKNSSRVWYGQTVFKLQAIDVWLNIALPIVDLDGLWFVGGTTPPVDPPPVVPPPVVDPFPGIPANTSVAITDTGEVRVTDTGFIRIFAI